MTTTNVDTLAAIARMIRNSAHLYGRDLDAISEEDYTGCLDGVCRSPHEFSAEIVGFNRAVAKRLRGEETKPLTEEERAARLESLNTRAAGKAAVVESAEEFAAAVTGNTNRLGEQTMAPWQVEIPMIELVLIAMSHIMYHDAQLNYVQSYRGDGEMHWFD